MDSLYSLLIIAVFTAFPIVLWGYGSLYLSSNVWNRARFIFGMGSGAIAVIVIALLQGILGEKSLLSIIGFAILLTLLSLLAWMLTASGSAFIRGFLRRIILLHGVLFLILFSLFVFSEEYIGKTGVFPLIVTSLATFLIVAGVEEGVKHLSSIGLTAREFRFTRRDFLLFTFFITLGFVTLENIIYMVKVMESGAGSVLTTGLSRLVFSLPLHVFAASICVMMWWRALSYRFFSWQYIVLFSLGFISATLVHALYNTLLEYGAIIPALVLVGFGYFAFTQWLLEE